MKKRSGQSLVVVAVAAITLVGVFAPVRAGELTDTTTGTTGLASDSSGAALENSGPASCLTGDTAAGPLDVPFCLSGIGQVTGGSEPEGETHPAPPTCEAPPHSDKCPKWAGAYDQGYLEIVTAHALSPDGKRAFFSTADLWAGYVNGPNGAGGGGSSVSAVDSSTGQQVWAVNYDDPQGDRPLAADMSVSPDGAVLYVAGTSYGTLESGWDFVTIAYDTATGKRLWSSRYLGVGGAEGAFAVSLSGDGTALYVTGSSGQQRGYVQNYDYATVAYRTATGEQLWAARYGVDGNDQPLSVEVDASKVFVTGFSSMSGSMSYDGLEVKDTNSYDYATVAYDATTGSRLWERRDDMGGQDLAMSLGVAAGGSSVFVTGSTKPHGGVSEFATRAYDSTTGVPVWTSRYNRPSSEANDAVALVVSPDGGRLYVSGTTSDHGLGGSNDYATVAYDAGTGAEVWTRTYNHLQHDQATDIALSGDGERVYVTGASGRKIGKDPTSGLIWWSPWGIIEGAEHTDVATVAYGAADGNQLWAGRHNYSPGSSDRPAGVDVATSSSGRDSVIVTGQAVRMVSSDELPEGGTRGILDVSSTTTEPIVLAYDDDDPGHVVPARPPAPVVRNGMAEGSFSLMSMAHSLASAGGAPAAWDGTSAGDVFRYNSNSCTDAAPVNNISTNLTTYNTVLPGSGSPGSTRSHPFQFSASEPDAQGKSVLSGKIAVVACKVLASGNGLNFDQAALATASDADRPKIFIEFSATADRPATQEARFEGDFTITGGTGVYEDLTGSGRIHGYLFCLVASNRAGGCAEASPLSDVHYTLTGWYRDPTVPEAREMTFPAPTPVVLTPPAPRAAGAVEGPFSLMHMIHGGTWNGTAGAEGSANNPGFPTNPNGGDGRYSYGTMPCEGNAPVNNLSTNLTTYSSRLPGSASPASTRNQPFRFAVSDADHPRQRKITGTIDLQVCKRDGGPTQDGRPDSQRELINFEVTAVTERVSSKEVRFEGTFRIVGGTGVYEGLTGHGRIHGYMFCFLPGVGGNQAGECNGNRLRDGQYTMNGWYSDPTVAELGVGPTKVSIADDSPRSGQYSDQVTPKATLQDYEGKPIADAAVDFELKGAGGTRSWTSKTDADGVAAEVLTLDLKPGVYDLVASYAGTDKRGPSSDKVAFSVAKEATATALSVEGQTPKRTVRAKVADDDSQPVAGVPVQFYAAGKPIGTATTDADGVALLVVPARYQGGPHRFGASFAGDERYVGSSAEAQTQ